MINLNVKSGEIHAIMGRNGSGKSTLANIIAGREAYQVTSGDMLYNNISILNDTPEHRALEGIFMSFQYPVIIPGVNNTYFLKAALNAKRKHQGKPELDAAEFLDMIRKKLQIIENALLTFGIRMIVTPTSKGTRHRQFPETF